MMLCHRNSFMVFVCWTRFMEAGFFAVEKQQV